MRIQRLKPRGDRWHPFLTVRRGSLDLGHIGLFMVAVKGYGFIVSWMRLCVRCQNLTTPTDLHVRRGVIWKW